MVSIVLLIKFLHSQKYIFFLKYASDFEGKEDNNEKLTTIGGRAGRLLIHN